ncbi:phytoene desaturase family protein [Pseudonocardia acidicola]|uniref:NAD(P)/FAD-dependent oxidoreductase n=1 Tax=Pseudonocardia acidicola TaxID=2724939 RepID=A0ABX1SHX9_9PSEU|nr:NAD(P)/FAD-dependent oxidoreductase [Pseudonocardia acidicola]NMI01151.1 NAD(P)/FAD-dependent oxidoreductase [Pseudonocardia acidicola]
MTGGDTAIVVGAGPNGLAGAVALARAGLRVTVLEAADEIGGGTRTSELTVPGVLHDHCSAVHPMVLGSPFLQTLGLDRYGLEWCRPEVDLAHPLDTGGAGVLVRSLDETAAGLGVDGPAWRRLFGPLSAGFDALSADLMRPVVHVPRHPVRLAGFGLRALQPAALVARRWRTDAARALFAGVAAHAFHPFERPTSAAIGLMLTAAGHRFGWPVARGGSRAITDALAALLADLGGTIETGIRVRSLAELPPAAAVLLDLAPGAVADLAGDRLPARVARAYRRYRHGPGAFKVDLAVAGGVPWRNEHCRRAGTVHVGGTFEEIALAEREIHRGRLPERPFVLVAQQYLADPGRSAGDVHPVWAYAHVPHGYPGDATDLVLDQLERFAPGLRERIVGLAVRSAPGFAAYNANYVGGDIVTGANTELQVLMRPRIALDPYSTGIPGVFICSAATPPGAGVHGMGGANAARSALRRLRIPVTA